MEKILIVEDDFDIQELLQNFLQEAGYQTAVAKDGLEAVSMFSKEMRLSKEGDVKLVIIWDKLYSNRSLEINAFQASPRSETTSNADLKCFPTPMISEYFMILSPIQTAYNPRP